MAPTNRCLLLLFGHWLFGTAVVYLFLRDRAPLLRKARDFTRPLRMRVLLPEEAAAEQATTRPPAPLLPDKPSNVEPAPAIPAQVPTQPPAKPVSATTPVPPSAAPATPLAAAATTPPPATPPTTATTATPPAATPVPATPPQPSASTATTPLTTTTTTVPPKPGRTAAPLGLGPVVGASTATVEKMKSQFRVAKAGFDDTVRFVFFAGLEGTGHHFWESAAGMCASSGFCVQPIDLMLLLYTTTVCSICNAWNCKLGEYQQVFDRTVAMFRSKRDMYRAMGVGTVILNVKEGGTRSGEMSYPNYREGKQWFMHRPDVRVLAQAAEAAGIDLRVVVIKRHPAQMMHSTIEHRHFGIIDMQAASTWDNAASMASQLSSLDDKFFMCVDMYDTTQKMSPREVMGKLGSFIHPAFADKRASVWAQITTQAERLRTPLPDINEQRKAYLDQLSRTTNFLTAECARSPWHTD